MEQRGQRNDPPAHVPEPAPRAPYARGWRSSEARLLRAQAAYSHTLMHRNTAYLDEVASFLAFTPDFWENSISVWGARADVRVEELMDCGRAAYRAVSSAPTKTGIYYAVSHP
ncbi:hypothetical protein CALVIDRAFT_395866 [Calocera viscosa TUFC12733]|uniref:Uncharacterized protein n=1 Tax=Calocera viscosa (strain TUFC12733) TaxID=1330018 RepID=A0A167GAJ1_CALVF|nr:hypothetical protein CALVIDRAFT_395866 [Calocera viscosa TUFC12733]